MTQTPISSRSDLLKLLCEACELEHGIACSYLYAAFSLKQDLSEGGLSWDQLQKVRRWAGQLYFIASQEMLHLAQVWNMLTAIGGMPYYLRPNFPQASSYYPIHLPLVLEPFGLHSLRRFVLYEHPRSINPKRNLRQLLSFDEFDAGEIAFSSVGAMYDLIRSGFDTLPENELFIGNKAQQIGPQLIDFQTIVPVTDRQSAHAAIDEITEQGEGTTEDRDDSHYGAFVAMLREMREGPHHGESFVPARPALTNPAAKQQGDYGSVGANVLEDERSRPIAELFDSVYSLMLRMLAYVFANNGTADPAVIQQCASTAILLMPRVIQPLGEALMLLPAGKSYPGKTAGPGFGLTRHVQLPPDPRNALTLIRERLTELDSTCAALLQQHDYPRQITHASQHLHQIQQSLPSH